MTHATMIKVLKNHGLTPEQQTGVLNGQLVKKATSFYDCLGKKDNYDIADVFEWLGY